MSDKLKDIENEIKKATSNRDNMTGELNNLTAKITRLQDDQQSALLSGRDSTKIETDLLAAQIRERGIAKVLSILAETLAKLDTDREAEIFARAKAEAAIKKQVITGLVNNLYKNLDTALATLDALQAQNVEYGNAVYKLGIRDPQLDNIIFMVNRFNRDLPQMIQMFPAEIWKEIPALQKA